MVCYLKRKRSGIIPEEEAEWYNCIIPEEEAEWYIT